MPARLEKDIPAHLRGERADKIVAELAGVSREQARRLFDHGVKVNGTPVEPNKRVAGGSIDFPVPPEEIGTVAEDVDFEVRFEDSHVLVVDKPAGIVGPSRGRPENRDPRLRASASVPGSGRHRTGGTMGDRSSPRPGHLGPASRGPDRTSPSSF